MFIDYMTKWVEAYAVSDQTSETIATLLIDNVVCRHGVPVKLISDRGCLLYTSPSPRDATLSRMPSSA